MVRKEDQIQMRQLLIDAVTLLCRSGMPFKTKFCVEALIGITLDDDDVVLVSFKETVCTDGTSKSQEYGADDNEISITETSNSTSMPLPPKRIKKENHSLEHSASQLENNTSTPQSRKRAHYPETKIKTELPISPNETQEVIKFMDCNKQDQLQDDVEDVDDCYFVKSEGPDYGEGSGEAWEGEDDGTNYGEYDGMGEDETGEFSNSTNNYLTGTSYIEGVDYFDGEFSTPQQATSQRRTSGRGRGSLGRGTWKPRAGVTKPRKQSNLKSELDPGAGPSLGANADEEKMKKRSTENKPFGCNICGLHYCRPNVLRDHVNAVHLNMCMFRCKACGRSFRWRHQLNTHRINSCPNASAYNASLLSLIKYSCSSQPQKS